MDPVTILAGVVAVALTPLLGYAIWVGWAGGRAQIAEARIDASERDRRTEERARRVRSELPGLRVRVDRARQASKGSMRRRFEELVQRANTIRTIGGRQQTSLKQYRQEVAQQVNEAIRQGLLLKSQDGGLQVAPDIVAAYPTGTEWVLDTVARFENAQRDAELNAPSTGYLDETVAEGRVYQSEVENPGGERDVSREPTKPLSSDLTAERPPATVQKEQKGSSTASTGSNRQAAARAAGAASGSSAPFSRQRGRR